MKYFGFAKSPTAVDISATTSACADVATGSPVTLWRLVHEKVRFGTEVEHQIEVLASRLPGISAAEVDRAHRTARDDESARIFATIEIDLIRPVDRLLRTPMRSSLPE
ncbi:hypothetical protein D8I24_2651 (plasmid) [Cupriavidus necator H850]|uniref:hypothetical protein n=1 Tax=Cupriavidus necator TaxID=106590 RepID=UPI00129E315D|nr:hypothetical protein [Cupriavidus necator]KAI3604946.1 hypothetical protein D8I24_2651 [Cupriavidus necator H850]